MGVPSNDSIVSQPHRRGSVIGFILSVHIRMIRHKLEKKVIVIRPGFELPTLKTNSQAVLIICDRLLANLPFS